MQGEEGSAVEVAQLRRTPSLSLIDVLKTRRDLDSFKTSVEYRGLIVHRTVKLNCFFVLPLLIIAHQDSSRTHRDLFQNMATEEKSDKTQQCELEMGYQTTVVSN